MVCIRTTRSLVKRHFTIDIGKEQIPVEGQIHKNVAIKYLMKRRRSLLMTRNQQKVENLYSDLPRKIKIIGRNISRGYSVNWEKTGSEEFQGSRYTFKIEESESAS
jgi:predicted NAD-dependent protein-ADP-ribosyltransferase YbiA (DUF1768 family)